MMSLTTMTTRIAMGTGEGAGEDHRTRRAVLLPVDTALCNGRVTDERKVARRKASTAHQ